MPDSASLSGIAISDLSLTLDQHRVFNGFSITFDGGLWHSLLGRSGAGKSVLLRLIAGLETAQQGRICFTHSHAHPTTDTQVAHMAQDDGLLPWLSVINNVQLGARLRSQANDGTRRQAQQLLEQVGLTDWAQALPDQLSGGMRQRVALARTLMEGRPIVLMDEPFSRLDAITRHELHHLAVEMLSACTVILVTHDPYEALQLSHQVHVLTQHHGVSGCQSMTLPGHPMRTAEHVTPYLSQLWEQLGQQGVH